jgi:predicted MPP superfamily phosphohydrolase
MAHLRILHLSDLHACGPDSREKWRTNRVLGQAWDDNLRAIVADGGSPDLVCFTGDIAATGAAGEYRTAMEFVASTLSSLGLDPSRLFVVPGNHDIDRGTNHAAFVEMREASLHFFDKVDRFMAGGRPPFKVEAHRREELLARQANYRNWVKDSLRRSELDPGASSHGFLGFQNTLQVPGIPFPIHVIGLDSSAFCGDDNDAQKLLLGETQIGRLVHDANGHPLKGLRLALAHHPLHDHIDAGHARRLLSDSVDLLLRGHMHEASLTTLLDPDRSFCELAAGCLYSGSDYPNSVNVVDLECANNGEIECINVRFRSWSPKGHWHDDSSVYREATAGRLSWRPRPRRPSHDGALPTFKDQGQQTPSIVANSEPKTATLPTPQALAYRARLEEHDARHASNLALRRRAFGDLAEQIQRAANELGLTAQGPAYASANAKKDEEDSLRPGRGQLASQQVSIELPSRLRWDISLQAVENYIKPWPYPEVEGTIGRVASSIQLIDGTLYTEMLAIALLGDDSYSIRAIERDVAVDADWISRSIEVLIGDRTPGLGGPRPYKGTSPVLSLNDQELGDDGDYVNDGKGGWRKAHGSQVLRQWLRSDLLTPLGSWVGNPSSGSSFHQLKEIAGIQRRTWLERVVDECMERKLRKYIQVLYQFDLIMPHGATGATLEVDLLPSDAERCKWRYNLPFMDPHRPPSGVSQTSEGLAPPSTIEGQLDPSILQEVRKEMAERSRLEDEESVSSTARTTGVVDATIPTGDATPFTFSIFESAETLHVPSRGLALACLPEETRPSRTILLEPFSTPTTVIDLQRVAGVGAAAVVNYGNARVFPFSLPASERSPKTSGTQWRRSDPIEQSFVLCRDGSFALRESLWEQKPRPPEAGFPPWTGLAVGAAWTAELVVGALLYFRQLQPVFRVRGSRIGLSLRLAGMRGRILIAESPDHPTVEYPGLRKPVCDEDDIEVRATMAPDLADQQVLVLAHDLLMRIAYFFQAENVVGSAIETVRRQFRFSR